jgi:hypothetical protein
MTEEERINLIHYICLYEDGISMLIDQEDNPDVRAKLIEEYDKVESMYRELEVKTRRL